MYNSYGQYLRYFEGKFTHFLCLHARGLKKKNKGRNDLQLKTWQLAQILVLNLTLSCLLIKNLIHRLGVCSEIPVSIINAQQFFNVSASRHCHRTSSNDQVKFRCWQMTLRALMVVCESAEELWFKRFTVILIFFVTFRS